MHLKLLIQYDGTDFVGSQLQAKGRTVQGELEGALLRLTGEQVKATLAGRTDSGVHAWAQVASLDFPERARLDAPSAIQRALNGILPQDIAVTGAEVAPEGFHARFSARKRAYRYLLWNAPAPLPLLRYYSLHVRQALDIGAMQGAVSHLVGTHDMAAFAGNGMGVPPEDDETGKPSTIRTIYLARLHRLDPNASIWAWDTPETQGLSQEDGLLAVDIVANAFLPQMIRTIVGTLLEVGAGKRTVENMIELMESRDRANAGPTARPQGLCLLWVEY
jgi:tRNA pseudouridine38-40 synthase